VKPYYEEEDIVIYNGDALKIMPTLADKSFDLVLTDIPYNEVSRESNGLRNLDKDDADICNFSILEAQNELIRLSRGSGYIFCGWEQISGLINNLVKNKLSARIGVWQKTNPSPMNGKSIWLSGIELCAYWKNKGATFNEIFKSPVWEFSSGRSKRHPTEKPLKLFEYLMSVSSNEGGIIIDPFMGSGTSLVAAKKLGRKAVGIEISEKYCGMAVDRIKETKRQFKLF